MTTYIMYYRISQGKSQNTVIDVQKNEDFEKLIQQQKTNRISFTILMMLDCLFQ